MCDVYMFSFEQKYNVSVVIEDLELINSAKLKSEERVWGKEKEWTGVVLKRYDNWIRNERGNRIAQLLTRRQMKWN
jgi:hypothetical protein